MKIESVASAQTAELVAFYNLHNPEKIIKKFADRATAEKRVGALIAQIEADKAAEEERKNEALRKAAKKADEADARRAQLIPSPTEPEKKRTAVSVARDKAKPGYEVEHGKDGDKIVPAASRSNSAGIAASWNVQDVRDARLTRNGVIVVTEKGAFDFNSTKSAFIGLGLPLEKHIRFRVKLKEAGKLTFEHEGKKYDFQVVG